jgi:pimeloyl-ACP methyl ester carboxylesterase
MGSVKAPEGDLYYEDKGHGVPILLIPPAGATAATWGAVAEELVHAGRVIAYDRRGYSRSPGQPVHSIPRHTVDAAALLDALHIHSAVVAGTSVGATIAIDLALRRPDLVRTVIAYESPWRASRRRPTTSSLAALAGMGGLALRGRHADAAEHFLRWAYTYRGGGTAWDAVPEQWRHIARDNAKAVLADIRIAIGSYPPPEKLAAITTSVICAHGTRSDPTMAVIARSLANAIPAASVREIEGAGHAVAFDAPATFVKVIAEAIPSQ